MNEVYWRIKKKWFINPNKPIDITWHSLWWGLAQVLWVMYKRWKENIVWNVYTFNAPGVKNIDSELEWEDLSYTEKNLISIYKNKIETSRWNPGQFNYILNIWNKDDAVFETNIHVWDIILIDWKKHWAHGIYPKNIV